MPSSVWERKCDEGGGVVVAVLATIADVPSSQLVITV